MSRRLADAGVLVGQTYGRCGYVWVLDPTHCAVVKLDQGIVAEALGESFVANGQRVMIRDISAVVSFVEQGNIVHRGVKLELRNGREVLIAEEAVPADPTSDRTDLELDGAWIVELGSALATQLQLVHKDELRGKVTQPPPPAAPSSATDEKGLVDALIEAYERWDDPDRVAARAASEAKKAERDAAILDRAYLESGQRGDLPLDVAVAKMADFFAGRIESAPETEPLHQPLPELDNGGYVVLELKRGAERCALELRVESPSATNTASEIVKQGARRELVTFLRSPTLPSTLIPVMEKLTEATREDR